MTSVTRESKQAGRRARVLQVSMSLASQGGYDAVQMRDVAAQAEVALGTLYRYFSSKDVLLISGLASWSQYSLEQLRSTPIQGDAPAPSPGHRLGNRPPAGPTANLAS